MSKTTIGYGAAISRAIRAALVPMAAAGLLIAAPAAAQLSEGYKFLDAVKKKEGEKVEQALADSSQIVNTRDVTTGETALHLVTQRRDLTWLQYLVAKGANVNLADSHGRIPLQLAVNLGWREGAQYLIGKGSRTDYSNDAGETPLITAVHRRDAELMKALLQAGADPDRADNSGRSARDYARLDANGANLLSTIQTYAKKGAAKAAKPVYGPVF